MAKIDNRKVIQRRRTAEELRKALLSVAPLVPTDSDEPACILRDGIEELLEARGLLEEMRNFVTQWHARFRRR